MSSFPHRRLIRGYQYLFMVIFNPWKGSMGLRYRLRVLATAASMPGRVGTTFSLPTPATSRRWLAFLDWVLRYVVLSRSGPLISLGCLAGGHPAQPATGPSSPTPSAWNIRCWDDGWGADSAACSSQSDSTARGPC